MADFNYFDLKPIISRNAYLNFIISNRGVGKTYSAKEMIVKRFEKKDKKFLFLKRTETELEATVDGFWDDFETEKRVFKHVKNRFYIGNRSVEKDADGNDVEEITWKLLGYSAALSTTVKLKGISPQDVEIVLWDEFIAFDGRYLRDEATRLLNVLETVGRMSDSVRLIAMGNKNEDGYIPIFNELGLSKSSDFEDNKIYPFRKGEILIYSFTNEAYVKAKSKTKLGRVAKGTEYYEKMIENKNQSNFSDLVALNPKRSHSLFSIVCKGYTFNVSFVKIDGQRYLYFEATDRPLKYVYTTDKLSPTIPRLAGNGFDTLYGYITADMARFDDQVTAQRVIEAIISKRR